MCYLHRQTFPDAPHPVTPPQCPIWCCQRVFLSLPGILWEQRPYIFHPHCWYCTKHSTQHRGGTQKSVDWWRLMELTKIIMWYFDINWAEKLMIKSTYWIIVGNHFFHDSKRLRIPTRVLKEPISNQKVTWVLVSGARDGKWCWRHDP